MKPFFFGASEQRLFGVYHAPKNKAPHSQSILICSPISHEYMRSYHIIRQLSEKLANSGHHVLRFDWYGYGDSYGEPENGSISIWINNIQYALDELLSNSNTPIISIIGLRFGASILTKAIGQLKSIKNMVLWDPVISGKNWLQELNIMHANLLKIAPLSNIDFTSDKEFLGLSYPLKLQEEIGSIDLLQDHITSNWNTLLCISDKCDGYQNLVERFKSTSHRATSEVINFSDIWNDYRSSDRVIISHPALPKIVKFFCESLS